MSTNDLPKRRRRRKKRSGGLRALWRDIYDQYGLVIKPFLVICGMIIVVGGLVLFIRIGSTSIAGRTEKEYMGRTTSKWLELEAEGKARGIEALWKDNRRISLETVLKLDWAAVPVLLDALKDPRKKNLAEATLGQYQITGGVPNSDDILLGLSSKDGDVQLWSVRLASVLKFAKQTPDVEEIVARLQVLSEDDDDELAEEAQRALEQLSLAPGKS